MPYSLSLNTNPLVNRFANPDDLVTTIARDLKVRDIQLTHEFINPSWPPNVIRRLTREFDVSLNRTGARITSGMTGPYGRLNNFGHPDKEVRRYYVDWFKTFADIIGDLGGQSIGTQFAIFTYADFDNPTRREELINIAMDCWAEVAEHGKRAGLEYVFWEPMSIGREFGDTIASCLNRLMEELETRITPLLEPIAAACRQDDAPTGRELANHMMTVVEGGIVMAKAHGDPSRISQALHEFRRYVNALVK